MSRATGAQQGPARQRWRRCAAWALVPCALALAACQGYAPAGRVAPQPATPAPAPSGPKVVVVDFDKVVHAHPRWADVNALDQRIARLEGQLSAVSPQMQVPQLNLEPQLQATAQQEVANARPQFQEQFTQTATALRQSSQKEVAAFVAQVRSQQQAQFDEQQKTLLAQVQKAIADKQTELNQDTAQFQQQMLEQYRLPLVNLQLKQTALQGGDRQQQAQVAQQIAALTAERDGKIDAHEKANQQALVDFQKQQQDSYNQQIKDLETQLSAQGQQQIDAKQAEVEQAFRDQMTAKQAQLNAQMNTQIKAQVTAREQALIAGAREQMVRAQQQAIAGAQAQVQSLRAQLVQAEAERARLLDSILADVRVEAAAMAGERGYDMILTRAVASVDVPDVTAELIARIKR